MRTESVLTNLCGRLQSNCGDIMDACKHAGVSMIFVNQWRKDDAKVNEQLLEAERVGVQGLVSAAVQRAVRGVEEDVYFKGAVVGQKTVYSDGLLQTLLKAKVPEFSKDGENGTHVTVNVANVMPRAATYEDWIGMRERTLAPPPKMIEAVEAEFTEVPVAFGGIEL